MKTNLSFSEIKPFIRYSQKLNITPQSRFLALTAYDHRFFFCADGHGYIDIDGTRYPMNKGCVLIWQAGLKYNIVCESDETMLLLGFNFDYTQNGSLLRAPIPPSGSDFDEASILERLFFTDTPCLNSVVYLNNMHLLEKDIRQICDEYICHRSFYDVKTSALFTSILTEIVRDCMLEGDNIRRSKNKVEEILHYIAQHYNEEVTNRDLGSIFGYHPNYINHLVVQHTGMSLHKYLLSYRINRAIEMLQTTDLPVSEISEQVGFCDYNHFLKYFKRSTGYTTKAFRAK